MRCPSHGTMELFISSCYIVAKVPAIVFRQNASPFIHSELHSMPSSNCTTENSNYVLIISKQLLLNYNLKAFYFASLVFISIQFNWKEVIKHKKFLLFPKLFSLWSAKGYPLWHFAAWRRKYLLKYQNYEACKKRTWKRWQGFQSHSFREVSRSLKKSLWKDW